MNQVMHAEHAERGRADTGSTEDMQLDIHMNTDTDRDSDSDTDDLDKMQGHYDHLRGHRDRVAELNLTSVGASPRRARKTKESETDSDSDCDVFSGSDDEHEAADFSCLRPLYKCAIWAGC